MADFLQGLVRQRQLQEAQAQRQGMMRQRMLAEQAEQARLEAWRQQQLQQQGALRQQALQQQAGIAAGNLDVQNRRLNLTERRMREAQLSRDKQAARTDLNDRRGTLRPGYRWKADNPLEQELVPGGPEEIKLRGAHADDLSKLQSVADSTQQLAKTIDYILDPKNKGGFTSNFGGWNAYLTRLMPGIKLGPGPLDFSRTGDVDAAVDRLKELAEVQGLGNVRGAASQSVGAITEREWPKFASQLLKINPRMEEDTARRFLQEARQTALDIRNRGLRAYENEWKPTPFFQAEPFKGTPPQRTPAPKGVAQEDWDFMSPEDRALWKSR